MRPTHSLIAFALTSFIIVHSLWTEAQTFSFNWTLIVLDYCVLVFYFIHFLWALFRTP